MQKTQSHCIGIGILFGGKNTEYPTGYSVFLANDCNFDTNVLFLRLGTN